MSELIDNNEKRLIANEIMRQLYVAQDWDQLEILVGYGKVCLEQKNKQVGRETQVRGLVLDDTLE